MEIHQDGEDMWGVVSEERTVEGIGDVRVVSVMGKEEAEAEREKKIRLASTTRLFCKTRFPSLLRSSLLSISFVKSGGGFSFINMLYKRKKDKVRPVDQPHPVGTVPEEQET